MQHTSVSFSKVVNITLDPLYDESAVQLRVTSTTHDSIHKSLTTLTLLEVLFGEPRDGFSSLNDANKVR